MSDPAPLLPGSVRAKLDGWLRWALGYILLAACIAGAASLLTWSVDDPSFTRATDAPVRNLLGPIGAIFADLAMRLFGLAGVFLILPPTFWALQLITRRRLAGIRLKLTLAPVAVLLLASAASSLPRVATWPGPFGFGGFLGDEMLRGLRSLMASLGPGRVTVGAGLVSFASGLILLMASLGLSPGDLRVIWRDRRRSGPRLLARFWRGLGGLFDQGGASGSIRREPTLDIPPHLSAVDRIAAWRAGPSFDRETRPAADDFSLEHSWASSEPARPGEFEGGTDTECHAMARRFAPEPPEQNPAPGSEAPELLPRDAPFDTPATRRRRAAARSEQDADRAGASAGRRAGLQRPAARKEKPEQKPVWPGSVPLPAGRDAPPEGRRPPRQAAGDELYSRAVAIVRADRKASTDYLQQRLGIGYMRAADLIDRMEQEGILGAPVRNGMRPILGRGPRTRIV